MDMNRMDNLRAEQSRAEQSRQDKSILFFISEYRQNDRRITPAVHCGRDAPFCIALKGGANGESYESSGKPDLSDRAGG